MDNTVRMIKKNILELKEILNKENICNEKINNKITNIEKYLSYYIEHVNNNHLLSW